MKRRFSAAGLVLSIMMLCVLCVPVHAAGSEVIMYRMYNPNSGEHFFTSDVNERNSLYLVGWNAEGVGWYAPTSSSVPVYRLYNKNGGEHHYTTNEAEKKMLVKLGWSDEGIGWYSDDNHGTPLYRVYNPNAFANNHHYTTNAAEKTMLVNRGWRDEGIGWYGCNNDEGLTEAALPQRNTSSSTTPAQPAKGTQKYATPYGKKYHLDPNCGGKHSYPTSDEAAAKRGLTPCEKCAQ